MSAAAATPAPAFDMDDVVAQAKALAEKPFEPAREEVPEWLLKISYDEWRDIRFRGSEAVWKDRGLPWSVQFFHAGLFYDRIVRINVVDADGVRPVEFSPDQFDYGRNDFESRVPQKLGFAGFRLHYPIKTSGYHDEVIVFLGASYFRALGKNEVFGQSARGLAIDTALPSGEEFPYFKEFWLVRPTRNATDIVVYALLDSPSLTGAYRFVVYPGDQTIVDVDVQLMRRKQVTKLAMAPLTSMFYFGENTTRDFDDFRPEAHDTDGLLINSGSGEWLWRPLDNPATLQVNAYQMHDPRGFGLIQRDREYDHYQDLEARSELRPSVWVAPKGGWGTGRVELVEIPTDDDVNDNIVAFWVPDMLPAEGEPIVYSYRMHWYGEDAARPPAGRTVATRRETGKTPGAHRFVVDFMGKELKALPADTILRGVVTVAPGGDEGGEILDQQVMRNPVTGGWRLAFQVVPKVNEPLELRAFLDHKGAALTETWSCPILP